MRSCPAAKPAFPPGRRESADRPDPANFVKTVEVITKRGCHLCDLALGELDLMRETLHFSVKLTYLEERPELNAQFGNDIPVIRVDEQEVCRHRVNRAALHALLTNSESNASR